MAEDVVHVQTQEQWDAVSKALGRKWTRRKWSDNGHKSCITFRGSDGEYLYGDDVRVGGIGYATKTGLGIISFDDWKQHHKRYNGNIRVTMDIETESAALERNEEYAVRWNSTREAYTIVRTNGSVSGITWDIHRTEMQLLWDNGIIVTI